MINFIGQDIGVMDTVYINEKQGSHGRRIGIVTKILPKTEVKWVLELSIDWKKISITEQRSLLLLVKLPADTILKLLP